MTVNDLRKLLARLPPDQIIAVLSQDGDYDRNVLVASVNLVTVRTKRGREFKIEECHADHNMTEGDTIASQETVVAIS